MNRKTVALQAAKMASELLKKCFRVVRKGHAKPDGSLVSAADRGAEKLIISAIKKKFPLDGILSEESPESQGQSDFRWIIDPLDATHNFLAGLPIFGTLLALEKDGKIILSVCTFPIFNETFFAEKGCGAFLNGKRIRVSKTRALEGGMCCLDSNKKLPKKVIFNDIKNCVAGGMRWRMFGSCEVAMARLALGSLICALSRCGTPWDYAASAFLAEEAGGRVTDLEGNPWSIHSQSLLATNGAVHSAALARFCKNG